MKLIQRVPRCLHSSTTIATGAAGVLALFVGGGVSGCSSPEEGTGATGGQGQGTGGSATGGQGGSATGGQSGTPATGGSATGGSATGGSATGGIGGSAAGAGGGSGSGAAGAGAGAGAGGAFGGMSGQGGASGAAGTAGKGGGGTGGASGASGSGGSAGGGSTGKSAGCGKAPTIASGMYNNGSTIAITVGNQQRRYILNVPTNYDNTKPYKLIIAFHQRDGNDKQMYANGYYHLLNLSGNNAIFVAPNGQEGGQPCTPTTNGDPGCGWPDSSGANVALADAVVNQVKENFCVDTNRIFATGWSYGGSMSYRTACDRALGATKNGVPGYIRAVAAYAAAQLSGDCTPSAPVAYYGSHGDNDGVLPWDRGVELARNYATANGCNYVAPTMVTSGNHMCADMMGCDAGYPLKFCAFDGDHTPDPRDPGQQTSWQYQVVWDWFNQF